MARVVKRAVAQHDLDEIAAYLQEKAGPCVAIRFLEAADRECNRLAEMPGLGSLCQSEHRSLVGLRLSPIEGFRNHLILYRPLADGIEVVRAFHGARAWEQLFET